MVDDTICTRLTTHAGTLALVGDKVYPAVLPQDPLYPAIVYTRVSDVPATTLDWTIRFREARYQVSCYAETRPGALALAEQVIDALHAYVGGEILKGRFENLVELVEPGAGPDGANLYHAAVDFIITF